LKIEISKYRVKLKNLNTNWDDNFAYIHSPALLNYEYERICGVTFGK